MNSKINKNQDWLSQLKKYGLNPKEWHLASDEVPSGALLFKNKKSPWMSLKAQLKEKKFLTLDMLVAL